MKLDGIPGDGRPANSKPFYPEGIVIQELDGNLNLVAGTAIDPNMEWTQAPGATGPIPLVAGFETEGLKAGVLLKFAFIFLSQQTPVRRQIVGRHEIGHASDHELFGPAGVADPKEVDHWTEGLMHRTADQSLQTPDGSPTFAPDSILRLRGRKR